MSFSEQYEALEQQFRMKAEKDDAESTSEFVFLPNMAPQGPVDFVLVAMEPSLRWWSKNREDAEIKKGRGFRNFAYSIGDFILHYAARKHLCTGGETYYITDLAKGATLVETSQVKRVARWCQWYDLFLEEIDLVAKKSAPITPIGQQVEDFLLVQKLPGLTTRIPHYSQRGVSHWRQECAELGYHPSSPVADLSDILDVVDEVLRDGGMERFADETLRRLNKRGKLTDDDQRLLFLYQHKLERVREQ